MKKSFPALVTAAASSLLLALAMTIIVSGRAYAQISTQGSAPDPISITLGATHVTLPSGGTTSIGFRVHTQTPINVTITLSKLPAGATGTLTPSSGTPKPDLDATLEITLGQSTAPETYAVKVTATDNKGHKAEATLQIEVVGIPMKPSTDPEPSSTTLAIALAAGVCVLACVIASLIVLRKRTTRQLPTSPSTFSSNNRPGNTRSIDETQRQGSIGANPLSQQTLWTCPRCERSLFPGARYCDMCGTRTGY